MSMKKVLFCLLTVVMVLGCLGVQAFAEDSITVKYVDADGASVADNGSLAIPADYAISGVALEDGALVVTVAPIPVEVEPVEKTIEVKFYNGMTQVGETTVIKAGDSITTPVLLDLEGYTLTGWQFNNNLLDAGATYDYDDIAATIEYWNDNVAYATFDAVLNKIESEEPVEPEIPEEPVEPEIPEEPDTVPVTPVKPVKPSTNFGWIKDLFSKFWKH